MFRSHITENTKARLAKINTEIGVIPGGLTSLLQPLDVGLNKPFKDNVRQEWNNWMLHGEKSFTKGGTMRAPSLDVLCEFVVKSWDNVKKESVIKSFKKCGISNAMDGTEDDDLFESDDEPAVDSPDSNWDPYDETAYCSSIAGALSLKAALTGLGVGEASATSLAATITWLLKDGCGMIASIAFAYMRGGQLDCNSKQWRLFADVANDLSHFLKLLAPILPVAISCSLCVFSAVMQSLVGVAGGSTRAAFSYHQARGDNMAEVSAKDGSQETMVNLAALITNITILPFVMSSPLFTWTTFVLCVFFHLLTNYLAVRAVKMESLNRPRLMYILSTWFSKSSIPGIEETNLSEPLFSGPAFIPDYFPFGFRLSLGCSFHEVMQRNMEKVDLGNYFTSTLEVLRQEKFMVLGDSSQRHLYIVYQRDISPQEELEAFYIAYLSVLNYVHLSEDFVLASEHVAPSLTSSSSLGEIISAVRLYSKKIYPDFLQHLKVKGWHTEKLLFAAGEWRIQT
ncbi:RUS family member 1-like [Macrobrachium nipponense]|uniref:RUS family member 1-like n=1 Tax=Macrobrachium nipponense TaxID=159736 RepID=UPI0030C7DED1